jgi:acyl-CoA thioesterase-1
VPRRAVLLPSVIVFLACTVPNAPAPTLSAHVHYLALGDSFTAGTGASQEESFPARLVARWSASGCAAQLTNLGVNGYTTADVLEQEVPELARRAPEFVTLAIGANDIVQGVAAEAYRAHVHEILAAVVAAGVKRIVAIPQPDWAVSPTAADFGSPDALHARIVELDAVLHAETQAVGGTYVDLSQLMEDEATGHMLARDALHPSAAAYDAWSEALFRVIPAPCEKTR